MRKPSRTVRVIYSRKVKSAEAILLLVSMPRRFMKVTKKREDREIERNAIKYPVK